MRKTFLFKPRQVLLANPTMKHDNNVPKDQTLKPDQKTSLLLSIAGFLQSNGFSKTLKKFRSEAKLEKDDCIDSSLKLEEIFFNYLETRECDNKSFSKQNVQGLQSNSVRDKEAENVTKEKKKRSNKDIHAAVVQSEDSSKFTNSKENGMVTDNKVLKLNAKSKDKKKSKKTSDSPCQTEQVSADKIKEPADSFMRDQQLQESKKKQKDKKKKKSKPDSETVIENVDHPEMILDDGKSSKIESKKDDSKTVEEGATDKESKQSKKRKRLASEDNPQPVDKNEVEDTKRRKTKGLEELKGSEQATEVNATPRNSNIDKGEKSASHKSTKEAHGSAEPTTVKAFQRVNIDEVEFTDDRLKDNSYWAKDGADSGYGAKAQEVLGQVRGRDFRHEKTKKKRGSYRGGPIDLQSHSVKFNYSDEE